MNIIQPTSPPIKLKAPWLGVGKKIERRVRKALYEFSMCENAHTWLVALSGGKDSITLLAMLKSILGYGFPSIKLHACFIDGAYTCGAGVSRKFLSKVCEELEIPLHIKESTIPLEKLECYGCSRKRRSLLFDCAKEIGATHIAFGHHRDDQVETLLMNLLHKAEFAGLLPVVPMKKYDVTIVRPLILVPQEEIIDFAKQCGFYRITCQCPIGQKSLRKRTSELLKEMEKVFPKVRHNLGLASLEYGSKKALEP